MKPNVVCLEPLSEGMKGLLKEHLKEKCNVHFFDTPEEGSRLIPEAEAIVIFTKGLDTETIKHAVKCRIVQKLGAGYDKVDRGQLAEQNILLTVAKARNSRSVAEHTVMLMLAVYKHLNIAYNSLIEGKWYKTALRDDSYELSGKIIGLIGLGSIGKEVVQLLRGFECDITYYDIYHLTPEEEKRFHVHFSDLDELVRTADIISLHVSLTDQTKNMINKELLSRMKPTSILINTCRGGVVDEQDLFEALRDGCLLGAGLDVFSNEPLDLASPLRGLNNVILTPHIGGGTKDAMRRVIGVSSQNILNTLFGDGPAAENVVPYSLLN